MTRIATLIGPMMKDRVAALQARFPQVAFHAFSRLREAVEAFPEDTEILVANGSAYKSEDSPASLMLRMPKLRWIQALSAGVDGITPHVPPGVAITNVRGMHREAVAEHALGLLLAVVRFLPFQGGRGPRGGVKPLDGQTHVIVGFGSIGQEIGRLSEAFGMRVQGVRRHPESSDRRQFAMSEFDGLLPEADVVTMACALTPETRFLLNAGRLALLPPHAVVVNIARAQVIDQEALVEALAAGRIGGAGLDVTDPEPLPADHPLRGFPNVAVTPHIAGVMPDYAERALSIFSDNLERYLEGRPLLNEVDRELGY